MQQYKTLPGSFKEFKKARLLKLMPWAVVIMLVVMVGIHLTKPADQEWDTWMIVVFPALFLLMLYRSFARGLDKYKDLFESFTVTISSNAITRQQANTPEITLYFKEIKSIVKKSSGVIILYANDHNEHISIPAQIENKVELEAALQQIQPFSNAMPRGQQYQWLLTVLMLVSMFCVGIVNNKIIVAVGGAVFAVLMIRGIQDLRTNKNIPHQIRNNPFWYYFVTVCVIVTAIAKVSGLTDDLNLSKEEGEEVLHAPARPAPLRMEDSSARVLSEPSLNDCVFDTGIYHFTTERLYAWKPGVVFTWDKTEQEAVVALDNGDSLRLHIGGCNFFLYAATVITNATEPADTAALHQKAVWAAKTFLTALDKRWPVFIAGSKVEKDKGDAAYVMDFTNPDTLTNISFDPVYVKRANGKYRIEINGGMN